MVISRSQGEYCWFLLFANDDYLHIGHGIKVCIITHTTRFIGYLKAAIVFIEELSGLYYKVTWSPEGEY